VVFDKLGNTYVSWRDDVPIVGGEGKHAGVYVAVRPPKGRFSGVERLLSQRPAVTIFPDIAATGSSAVASWSISDALGTFVQAVTVPAKVTRTSSEEPSPPEEEAEPLPAEGGSGGSSPPAPEPSRASSAGATTATATTSWSQVTRALSPESVPGGQNPPAPPPRVAPLLLGIPRATAIASLLRAGAVGERVVAPSSGTATIRWFDSTSPQSRTSKSDQTRLLIASGKRDFARAGTGVVRVRLTHAGAVALRRARHNVLVAALATFTPVLPAADRYDGRATRLEISRRFALTR
jgi:hypothetical protein